MGCTSLRTQSWEILQAMGQQTSILSDLTNLTTLSSPSPNVPLPPSRSLAVKYRSGMILLPVIFFLVNNWNGGIEEEARLHVDSVEKCVMVDYSCLHALAILPSHLFVLLQTQGTSI